MADRLEQFLALPPRQRQVVRMVASGSTRYEAAEHFGISPTTVHKHLVQAYARIGLDDEEGRMKIRQLSYLIGFVDGHSARHVRMVSHKREAA